MTIDLHRLDSIDDCDEFIEALDDYLQELVGEFVDAAEGKAYLAQYPDMNESVGSWIYHLLYLGYNYESVTLPRMNATQVEAIVTKLFPRKIMLAEPDDANSTIPELLAFWQFLQRVYKPTHGAKVVKLLEQLQPKFKSIMNDRSNFGIGKSVLSEAMGPRLDLLDPDSLMGFNSQSQQSIDIQSIANLINTLGGKSSIDPSSQGSPSPRSILDTFRQQLQVSMWESGENTSQTRSPDAIALLTQTVITETSHGTILKDFQTLLNFIGQKGIVVSTNNHSLPMKSLGELNQLLSEPVAIDLKRPVQKSYPPIDGLYLILRALGLGQIRTQGKKYLLILDPNLLSIWHDFNPTERYCTLLEAWLIRGNTEILDGKKDHTNSGSKCFQYWATIPTKGQKIPNYEEQRMFNFWPEVYNLALLKMFGFIQIDSGKPTTGKGWRIKGVKKLPFGDALIPILFDAYKEMGMYSEAEDDPSLPISEFQPTLQPYFPEWKKVFQLPACESRSGVYIFKVALRKCWRKIAISSDLTLDILGDKIRESVDFDDDHMDLFTYKNQLGRSIQAHHSYSSNEPQSDSIPQSGGYANEIGDLPLEIGSSMEYLFDFGDNWKFEIQLEQINADDTRQEYVEILESFGIAPEQYPEYED
jgi:Plasmid pRiA4b ORF-3-like protein